MASSRITPVSGGGPDNTRKQAEPFVVTERVSADACELRERLWPEESLAQLNLPTVPGYQSAQLPITNYSIARCSSAHGLRIAGLVFGDLILQKVVHRRQGGADRTS